MLIDNDVQGPCINKNMPPVAGLMRWSQEFRERIEGVMVKIRTLNHGYALTPLVNMQSCVTVIKNSCACKSCSTYILYTVRCIYTCTYVYTG